MRLVRALRGLTLNFFGSFTSATAEIRLRNYWNVIILIRLVFIYSVVDIRMPRLASEI
jgi:hypothetical protein